MDTPLYRRVLLKLSGEALCGDQAFGFEHKAFDFIARSIKEVYQLGVQIGIVIGGGNIFRGSQSKQLGFERTPADQVGMLGTIINGLILQQALASVGIESTVFSALQESFVQKYCWKDALQSLEKGRIVIFVGGTGNPYFTTDTAAALRASEMQVEALFKATKVSGVYTDDPLKNPNAEKFTKLSYSDALIKKLNVMDATALAMCRENKIPIYVFNFFEPGAFKQALCKQQGGTLLTGE